MKISEKKTRYRVVNKKTGEPCSGLGFKSVSSARNSNYYGPFKNKSEYRIEKWSITYKIINKDCDNAGSVNAREDGLPYDFDSWPESQKTGFLIGKIGSKQ